MGAWGTGPFENDDAADWSFQFEETDRATGQALVAEALGLLVADEYVEAPEGSVAVAAAQVVAWLVAPESIEESADAETVVGWVRSNPGAADDQLIESARRLLTNIRGDDSELAELWDEAGERAWEASLVAIEERLTPGTGDS